MNNAVFGKWKIWENTEKSNLSQQTENLTENLLSNRN